MSEASDSKSTVVALNPGDDLARAFSTLPKCGTLLFNPGVYVLSSALEIDRDCFLKSATGNERDVVLVREGGAVLNVRGGAPVFEALTILSPEERDEFDDRSFDAEPYEAAIFVDGGAPTFVDVRVSSAQRSGFGVRGNGTSIRLSRCEIRKTGDGGIFLDSGARGTLEDCGVYDATLGCVDVEDGAFCEIRRSRLHRSSFACLSLHNGGAATLRDSELFVDDGESGVCVVGGSKATLATTKIVVPRPFFGPAVLLRESVATLDGVTIDGFALVGVDVDGESVVSLAKCSVRNCGGSVVYDKTSTTTFDACDFERPPLERAPQENDANEKQDENDEFDDDFDDDDDEEEEEEDDGDGDENDDFYEEDESSEFNEQADFVEATELKTRLLEEILGPAAPRVGRAIVPYPFGGALELYYYPRSRFGGTFFASQELVDPLEFDGPSDGAFDAFEVAIATRHPYSDEALDESSSVGVESDALEIERDGDDDEEEEEEEEEDRDADFPETSFKGASSVFHRILTNLARYVESDGVVVNRFDTLEFPNDFEDAKLAGRCFVFDALSLPRTETATERWRRLFDYFDGIEGKRGDSRIGGARFGVLLAIQVFRGEMNWARENGTRELLAKLKATGAYPFSDLDREPVV